MDHWVLTRAADLLVRLEPSDLGNLFYALFHGEKKELDTVTRCRIVFGCGQVKA